MELALSLGDHPPKPFSLLDHHNKSTPQNILDFGFCMGTALETTKNHLQNNNNNINNNNHKTLISSPDQPPPPPSPPQQLDLLPFSPVLRSPPPQQQPSHRISIPWLTNMVDVKVKPLPVLSDQETGEEPVAGKCSPNGSDTSSFQMDFSSVFSGVRSFGSRKHVINHLELIDVKERGCSRGSVGGGGMSDDDENGLTRKKLRLTKEQSSFLEDSFKEHNTLNPKQKQALAKQLNLRPRQVEVWFQNRRARTKLKQTEVDCEYLKRCCETLTEENRRLQKELQELRALKTSQPFYMQRPATTLTMCPSCERVATSTTTPAPSEQPPAATASHIH